LGAVVRDSSPYAFGTNFPVYWGRRFSRDEETRAQIADAVTFARWPGGTPANEYVWDLNWTAHPYFDKWSGQFGSEYIQTADEFILTMNGTKNPEPLIQMNAAMALVEGVPAAVEHSLSLLRYFEAAGIKVKYVAFGNENYGPWEPPYGDVEVNGETYGKAFAEWVQAMREEFPDIYYGVVGLWNSQDGIAQHRPPPRPCGAGKICASLQSGVIQNWMEDMLSKTDAIKLADWIVLHEYFHKGGDVLSTEELLANVDDLSKYKAGVQAFIDAAAPGTHMPPLALTEFSIAQAGSGNTNSTAQLSSALFLASVIGETLTNAPVGGLNEFAWHAKWKFTGDKSGSYGMVTFGSPDVDDNVLLPKYFAMNLFRRVTGSKVLDISSSVADMKIYASQFSTGEFGLVFVNAGQQAYDIELPLEKWARAEGWVLEGNTSGALLDAYAVTVNGVGNGLPVGGPWPLNAIAPYVLTNDGDQDCSLAVPASSLVAVVVWPDAPLVPTPAPPTTTPAPAPVGPLCQDGSQDVAFAACGYNCDDECNCGHCNTKPGCMSEDQCMGNCNGGNNAKWCGGASMTPVGEVIA